MITFMAKSYVKIINKSKNRDSKVIANFKKDFLLERYLNDYFALADYMNEQSIKNAFNSVFSKFEFKKYDATCNILFMHGTKGNEFVSKKSAIKMKEANPQTEIRYFK